MHIECTVFTTLSKIIQYNPKQHVPLRMGFIFSGYYTELCCDKTIRLVTLAQPLTIRRLYYTRTRTTNILLIKFYTDLIETLKISERTHSFWFFFMSFLQLQWLWHEAIVCRNIWISQSLSNSIAISAFAITSPTQLHFSDEIPAFCVPQYWIRLLSIHYLDSINSLSTISSEPFKKFRTFSHEAIFHCQNSLIVYRLHLIWCNLFH